eukprot:1659861-Pleurochrysis_carterae.AAC.1
MRTSSAPVAVGACMRCRARCARCLHALRAHVVLSACGLRSRCDCRVLTSGEPFAVSARVRRRARCARWMRAS